ncbi:MAG: zf-HC2 domain-containing protein [Acidobacteriota bacterium]
MDPWTDRLSEYLDDELEPAERSAVEQHLASCASCRNTLEGLRDVARRAAALPYRVPAEELWPGIERRVRAIAPARRTFTFSFVQLAAAAIFLMALSGGLVWMLRGPARETVSTTNQTTSGRHRPATTLPVSLADETYDQAVTDLQRALQQGHSRLDPNTIRIIEQNLQTIDAAIAQAQRALEADPSSTYLNGHLADARRRKLALLRSVSMMADPEG